MKVNLCVDFDGVLNNYTHYDNDDLFTPREGAYEFIEELNNDYNVIILTARDPVKVTEWLNHYGFRVEGVTNVKPPAIAYIDEYKLARKPVDDNGVIKTSVEFSDAARNTVKTLKGVMSRNLVVMIEGNEINDIENQLNIMKKIGNNTITVPAKYFNKADEVVKDELANLEKNYGINVIIEYQDEIDEKTEIKNAK